MLQKEYLVAKIGVDTAENEPLEVWGKIIQYYSFVSLNDAGPTGEFRAELGCSDSGYGNMGRLSEKKKLPFAILLRVDRKTAQKAETSRRGS